MSNAKQNDNSEFETITTSIWQEIAESSDPFVAKTCHCAGFDVYQDLLGKASWADYLYLLLQQQQPNKEQSRLLNDIAVAIANAGPRDLSVQAAMSAAAGGSTLASCLMAALAVGAGQHQGAHEIYNAMMMWQHCQQDLPRWQACLSDKSYLKFQQQLAGHNFNVWPEIEHPPGFAPYGKHCASPVEQTLEHLSGIAKGLTQSNGCSHLAWLQENRQALEQKSELPLAMTGVIAAAFCDLGFDQQQAELLYLLLRLPGAAAHALEQHRRGWRDYPFHRQGLKLSNDPGPCSQLTKEETNE